MSYKEELTQIKKARQFQLDFNNIIDKYSPFMTERAISENIRNSQMMINIYDQKIEQLEQLTAKQEQQKLVDAVVKAVSDQDQYVSNQLEKSLQSVFEKLRIN